MFYDAEGLLVKQICFIKIDQDLKLTAPQKDMIKLFFILYPVQINDKK